jgi:response regulator RpfG family c-di-GMP phosphodiesterase
MIPLTRTHLKMSLHLPVPQVRTLRFVPTNTSPAFWSHHSDDLLRQHERAPGSGPRDSAPLIYAVDDLPCLTELYRLVLEASGYAVKTFTNRAEALAALRAEATRPDLLIMDYRNNSMPVEKFMQESLVVHPELRILMASGLRWTNIRLFYVRPHRFLQKPFTPEELRKEVKAALATHSQNTFVPP